MDTRVYLVTDDPSRYSGNWLENVDAAVSGGVTCVQFRDTESSGRVRYERALALKRMLSPRRVPLVVDDDAALAVAVGADGVHVGQRDLPPDAVRRVVGPAMDIGFSVTSPGQVDDRLRAWLAGGAVNRLGVGPVWDATATKADAAAATGPAALAAVRKLAGDVPLVAIGGITPERAAEAVRSGADGIAAVSVFSRAADPAAAARRLRAIFGVGK